MKKIMLTEAVIYGVAGAIAGIVLTFVAFVCIFSVYTATSSGLDNSGTDDPGLIYLGGLVGAWWFSGVALCCGGPFGFLLGAYLGAELVVNEPTNGEDNSQKVERLFEKIDHLADLEPRLTEAEINEEIEAYRREKRG